MSQDYLLPQPKMPTICIVVDCHGQPIAREGLRYVEHLVGLLKGADYMGRTFWVTRTDLMYDFEARGGTTQTYSGRDHIGEEPRHEPSFDLYEDGGIVPIARLVNLPIPTPIKDLP
jgi:hypothetical protein